MADNQAAPASADPITDLAYISGQLMGTMGRVRKSVTSWNWLKDRGMTKEKWDRLDATLLELAECFYKDRSSDEHQKQSG